MEESEQCVFSMSHLVNERLWDLLRESNMRLKPMEDDMTHWRGECENLMLEHVESLSSHVANGVAPALKENCVHIAVQLDLPRRTETKGCI